MVKKKRILIVEDDIAARKALARYMHSLGFAVQEAESGEKAFELLKENHYNLVLTDLMMQEIDGIGVLEEVMKLYPRQTDVIIMTAFGSIDNVVKAMKSGAYDYITKPINLTELGILIERCIERQRLVAEVEGLKEVVNLYVMFKTISSVMEINNLLNVILKLACDSVNADSGFILLFEHGGNELNVKAVAGISDDSLLGKCLKIDNKSFAGFAASLRQPEIKKEINDDMWCKEFPILKTAKSNMSIPMRVKDEFIGTIHLIRNKQDVEFTKHDTVLAGIFAEQAAFAISNSWVYENLKNLSKLKSEFLANVTHELKTSLMSMRTSLDILLGGKAGNFNPVAVDLLKINKRGVDTMSGIVNNVLHFSQMEAGSFQIKKEQVELNNLIKTVVSKMKLLAEKKKITLKISLPSKLIVIKADSQRITQVLENLITNGIKFTDPQGKVSVIVRDSKKQIEIDVVDNGIGIPKEAHEKVFERFFMVDNSYKRQGRGVGLGLAISRKIIELHGGDIRIESGSGKGSKFSVTLPK